MTFSFVHMADVHFDTPFASADPTFRSFMRESTRRAFAAGVDLALEKKVDALLIAGDLFDNDTLSFATEKFLVLQLKRLQDAGIRVFYSPGNHDPWGSNFRLGHIPWPDNVHIFKTSMPETVPVVDNSGRTIAFITGAGHEGSREGRNLASAFPLRTSREIPHVGMLHTMVTGLHEGEHERYAPSTLADLISKDYTYWALGHIHGQAVLSDNPLVVYPGNLLGRNSRETGLKGVYLVQISASGEVESKFCGLAPVCWHRVKVNNLAGIYDLDSMERELFHFVAGYTDKNAHLGEPLLKIDLEGPAELFTRLTDAEDLSTLTDLLKESLNLRYLELSSERLEQPVDPDAYREGPHVLSEVLFLLDKIRTDEGLLLSLAPESFADKMRGQDKNQQLAYLQSLLGGLDYEAVVRLVAGDGK